MKVPVLAELFAEGKQPEILFWVGCSGSFDQRAQKITKAFVTILDKIKINYAILGKEEMCNGDPVRRAGNEFMFQMMAYQNIQTLNNYAIKKIVTACPHCFNILKNEYPALGGNYDVIHHSVFLQQLIDEGKIKLKDGGVFKGKKITYHDSCYLGRANNIYEAPRKVLEVFDAELVEMKRCKTKGLCFTTLHFYKFRIKYFQNFSRRFIDIISPAEITTVMISYFFSFKYATVL